MIKVYVSGPLTKGNTCANIRAALEAANQLADLGFAPVVPHLSHFWDMVFPRPYEYWIALDLEMISMCDAVLRLPGESIGADREVARANELGLPVFHTVGEIWVHRALLLRSHL